MIIRRKLPRALGLNQPLRLENHGRPVSRRDFLARGLITGAATVVAPAFLGALLNPRTAHALSPDINPLNKCNIQLGAGKVPFICFDLAGGANIAGSNVLVGQQGGQLDLLTTAGYSKLGLPGTMTPGSSTLNVVDTQLGLAFHSDSAFLRGILSMTSPSTRLSKWRRHSGGFAERHQQQSAQSHVRYCEERRSRSTADVDRFAGD